MKTGTQAANSHGVKRCAAIRSKQNADAVFREYGDPFITNAKGKIKLNERAVAAKCATVHMLRYDPNQKRYEQFDESTGLWLIKHETDVRRFVSDFLLKLGKEWRQQEFVHGNKNSQFSSIGKTLQPYGLDVKTVHAGGLLHVANGVLDLNGKNPKLLPHDPKYPFQQTSGIRFDRKAKCPRFEKQLLRAALPADDIRLIQKYAGSMLLGPNTSHGILIIRGTPGGGKSTLVSVFEKVLGEGNVAQLRTPHLSGRFETAAFINKRVLVGKDVPGDTLNDKGARLLKALVGGDLLQAEIKYNPTKQMIRGDYHVIIVSNNNLRIALDGDDGAWQRRLLIVDFENEKPAKPIADFADKLIKEEGSGILNWLIAGAAAYRKEMNRHGALVLTETQQQRVARLIHDSDSMVSFLEERLEHKEGSDVSSEELLVAYYKLCQERNWMPVSGHEFQTRIRDLICQCFHICRRNDVSREGKAVRGWKGIAFK